MTNPICFKISYLFYITMGVERIFKKISILFSAAVFIDSKRSNNRNWNIRNENGFCFSFFSIDCHPTKQEGHYFYGNYTRAKDKCMIGTQLRIRFLT